MTDSITPTPTAGTYPLGVSRPDLAVDDLPTPEEVFRVRRLGASVPFPLIYVNRLRRGR